MCRETTPSMVNAHISGGGVSLLISVAATLELRVRRLIDDIQSRFLAVVGSMTTTARVPDPTLRHQIRKHADHVCPSGQARGDGWQHVVICRCHAVRWWHHLQPQSVERPLPMSYQRF